MIKFVNRSQKKSQQQEVDEHGSWMISYGDMVTLLLAFFVLFFTVDPQKEHIEGMNLSLITQLKKSRDLASHSDTPDLNIGSTEEEIGISEKLVNQWGAKVHQLGSKIIIEFPKMSFFEVGDIKPRAEATKVLKEFVKVYQPYQGHYTLGIRAFTDKKKVLNNKHRYKDNLELSALRAIATMRILQNEGIPLKLMRLGGYGELIITQKEVEGLNQTQIDPDDLARTIMLVIEPKNKERKT